MQVVRIPWAHWYGDMKHAIWFPDDWEVTVADMEGAPGLSVTAVEKALDNPIGSRPLYEVARGRKSAGIVIDDISRPTPGWLLVPLILRRLEEAGLCRTNISVFLALGAHRPMTRQDMIKKLGEEVLTTVQVFNHNPFQDTVLLGKSKMGNPIVINRRFMETDLKISVGCILPHSMAGFGGGAKNIIPGLGGFETLAANHKAVYYEKNGQKYAHHWVGNLNNPLRADMEDIARQIGLEFIVNVVFNTRLEVAGVFAGDLVEAHRRGCEFAERVYRTHVVPHADVVVLNAYPKDTEFVQIDSAFNVAGSDPKRLLARDNSTIILTTAASEGGGFHNLVGPGMPLFVPFEHLLPPSSLTGTQTWIYSPNLSFAEIRQFFSAQPRPLYTNWTELLEHLTQRYPNRVRAAVYPLACTQMAN